MKQALRIVVPLVVMVAVIFGVTYFSRYTRKANEEQVVKSPEPPLRFGSSTRFWNPMGSLQERIFPGFYEVGAVSGTKNTAAFWFENRNTAPVKMELQGVTCLSCSGGRVAAIPPDVTRQLVQMSAIQVFPQGLVTGLPTGMVGPAANFDPLHQKLKWQSYDFEHNPNATYTIPAASNTDGWTPQWGILELLFSAAEGPKSITATFLVNVEGSEDRQEFKFTLGFEGVKPFLVSQTSIAIGEIHETSTQEHKFNVLVYSSTRGPGSALGDLEVPVLTVDPPSGYRAEPAPFVSIGTPARVPETELLALTQSLSVESKKPTRVRSAYRLPIIVRARVGDKTIDLGPLERTISLTVPNTSHSATISLTGAVRGGVWLDDNRKEIRLNDTYKRGASETYRLVTEQPDATLKVLEEETKPDWMKVTVKKLDPIADRGRHELKVQVDEQSKAGPWNGMIVLELEGKNPQRIRIPVFGRGSR